jgi:hypothetical protein
LRQFGIGTHAVVRRPAENATTNSLEALQAYGQGYRVIDVREDYLGTIPRASHDDAAITAPSPRQSSAKEDGSGVGVLFPGAMAR